MRLPQVSFNGFADIRNNVIYNWGGRGGTLMDETESGLYHMSDYDKTRLNAIGNHYKKGILGAAYNCSTNSSGIAYYGPYGSDCISQSSVWARQQFYVEGNTGCANGRVWQGYSSSCTAPTYYPQSWLDLVSSDFFSVSAHNTNGIPVTTTAMNDTIVDTILASAGATKPSRDSVDTGFVNDYYNSTGSTLADNHFPNNYPTFDNIPAPADTDSDGMADEWEVSNLGSINATSNGDFDGDGYLNIEEYFHFLGEYVEAADMEAPFAPTGLSVE